MEVDEESDLVVSPNVSLLSTSSFQPAIPHELSNPSKSNTKSRIQDNGSGVVVVVEDEEKDKEGEIIMRNQGLKNPESISNNSSTNRHHQQQNFPLSHLEGSCGTVGGNLYLSTSEEESVHSSLTAVSCSSSLRISPSLSANDKRRILLPGALRSSSSSSNSNPSHPYDHGHHHHSYPTASAEEESYDSVLEYIPHGNMMGHFYADNTNYHHQNHTNKSTDQRSSLGVLPCSPPSGHSFSSYCGGCRPYPVKGRPWETLQGMSCAEVREVMEAAYEKKKSQELLFETLVEHRVAERKREQAAHAGGLPTLHPHPHSHEDGQQVCERWERLINISQVYYQREKWLASSPSASSPRGRGKGEGEMERRTLGCLSSCMAPTLRSSPCLGDTVQQEDNHNRMGSNISSKNSTCITTLLTTSCPGDILLPLSLLVPSSPAHGATSPLPVLRPHQVSGIRFLWHLLAEAPVGEVPGVGAILAHAMGLGKTAQVIVFLHFFLQSFTPQCTGGPHSRGGDGGRPRNRRERRRRSIQATQEGMPYSYDGQRTREDIVDGEERKSERKWKRQRPYSDEDERDEEEEAGREKTHMRAHPRPCWPRVMVISPKSVISSWEAEFAKWRKHFHPCHRIYPIQLHLSGSSSSSEMGSPTFHFHRNRDSDDEESDEMDENEEKEEEKTWRNLTISNGGDPVRGLSWGAHSTTSWKRTASRAHGLHRLSGHMLEEKKIMKKEKKSQKYSSHGSRSNSAKEDRRELPYRVYRHWRKHGGVFLIHYEGLIQLMKIVKEKEEEEAERKRRSNGGIGKEQSREKRRGDGRQRDQRWKHHGSVEEEGAAENSSVVEMEDEGEGKDEDFDLWKAFHPLDSSTSSSRRTRRVTPDRFSSSSSSFSFSSSRSESRGRRKNDGRHQTYSLGSNCPISSPFHAPSFATAAADTSSPFSPILSEEFEKCTELVVCDEAHRLKNDGLQSTEAILALRPLRRLLLTGTPLQNHLMEYRTMLQCAVPQYFSRTRFRSYFMDPIEASTQKEATETMLADAKKRTYTLIRDISAFMQRVDRTPLLKELPPIYEFVVSVPLSSLQRKLYIQFIRCILSEAGVEDVKMNFLAAVAFSLKLTAHPHLVYQNYRRGPPRDGGGAGGTVTLTPAAAPAGNGGQEKPSSLPSWRGSNKEIKENEEEVEEKEEEIEVAVEVNDEDDAKEAQGKGGDEGRADVQPVSSFLSSTFSHSKVINELGGEKEEESEKRGSLSTGGSASGLRKTHLKKKKNYTSPSSASSVLMSPREGLLFSRFPKVGTTRFESICVPPPGYETEERRGTSFSLPTSPRKPSRVCPHSTFFTSLSAAAIFDSFSRVRDRVGNILYGGQKLFVALTIIIKAIEMNEKVLVFSTSTQLLDFFEAMLAEVNRILNQWPDGGGASPSSLPWNPDHGLGRSEHNTNITRRDGPLVKASSSSLDISSQSSPSPLVWRFLQPILSVGDAADDGPNTGSFSSSFSSSFHFPVSFVRLDGKCSGPARLAALHRFDSDPSCHVFLLSSKAGGVGLTITAATRVLLLDSSFNPADEHQAIGRAYRYGQKKPVFVYRLIAEDTLESLLFTQKLAKEWLFKTVVEVSSIRRSQMMTVHLRQLYAQLHNMEMVLLRKGKREEEEERKRRKRSRSSKRTVMNDREEQKEMGTITEAEEDMRTHSLMTCAGKISLELLKVDPLLAFLSPHVSEVTAYASYLEKDDESVYGEAEKKFYEEYCREKHSYTYEGEESINGGQSGTHRRAAAIAHALRKQEADVVEEEGRTLMDLIERLITERGVASSPMTARKEERMAQNRAKEKRDHEEKNQERTTKEEPKEDQRGGKREEEAANEAASLDFFFQEVMRSMQVPVFPPASSPTSPLYSPSSPSSSSLSSFPFSPISHSNNSKGEHAPLPPPLPSSCSTHSSSSSSSIPVYQSVARNTGENRMELPPSCPSTSEGKKKVFLLLDDDDEEKHAVEGEKIVNENGNIEKKESREVILIDEEE